MPLVLTEPTSSLYMQYTDAVTRVCCQWLGGAAKAEGEVRAALFRALLEQGKLLRWLSWMETLGSNAQPLLQVSLNVLSLTSAAPAAPIDGCAGQAAWLLSEKQALQVGLCVAVAQASQIGTVSRSHVPVVTHSREVACCRMQTTVSGIPRSCKQQLWPQHAYSGYCIYLVILPSLLDSTIIEAGVRLDL